MDSTCSSLSVVLALVFMTLKIENPVSHATDPGASVLMVLTNRDNFSVQASDVSLRSIAQNVFESLSCLTVCQDDDFCSDSTNDAQSCARESSSNPSKFASFLISGSP